SISSGGRRARWCSTPPSIPTSRRWNRTPRRSSPTSVSLCSFPRSDPSSSRGVDLPSMPITAVYTRTITAPNSGLRVTGKVGSTAYTALATQDDGGGLVILPGPRGSDFALQDFQSDVGVLRVRRDVGRSFVSLLATGRNIEG